VRWSCQPPPVYHTSTYSPRRHVNVNEFKASLSQSTLCAHLSDDADDAGDDDSLADQYASAITSFAKKLAAIKTMSCRRRSSDVWFDEECLAARKECWRLERRSKRSINRLQQWHSELRRYRLLTRRKRAAFWCEATENQRSSPQHLSRSIDQLMGRAKQTASPDISAACVRASTDGADDPVFRSRSAEISFNTFQPVQAE